YRLPRVERDHSSQFRVRRSQAFDERIAVLLGRMEKPIQPGVLVAGKMPILTMARRVGAFEQAEQQVAVLGRRRCQFELQFSSGAHAWSARGERGTAGRGEP